MHVKEAVPKTTLDVSTPLAAWCQCSQVVCAAVAANERRRAGGDAGEAGWRAVRMVLTGLLPKCMKVVGMEEQERRRVEAAVARAGGGSGGGAGGGGRAAWAVRRGEAETTRMEAGAAGGVMGRGAAAACAAGEETEDAEADGEAAEGGSDGATGWNAS